MRRNPRAGARKSGGFRLEVFTDDELREIHLATLEVLSRTGVFVEDHEALEMFAAAGGLIAENLAGTADLAPGLEPLLVLLPLNIVGCDGAPVRAVALEPATPEVA